MPSLRHFVGIAAKFLMYLSRARTHGTSGVWAFCLAREGCLQVDELSQKDAHIPNENSCDIRQEISRVRLKTEHSRVLRGEATSRLTNGRRRLSSNITTRFSSRFARRRSPTGNTAVKVLTECSKNERSFRLSGNPPWKQRPGMAGDLLVLLRG